LTRIDHDHDLIRRAQSGDAKARDQLLAENENIVYHILRYSRDSHVYDDLTQEGLIGLLHAVDSFDLSYDVQFSTYAGYKILARVQRAKQKEKSHDAGFEFEEAAYDPPTAPYEDAEIVNRVIKETLNTAEQTVIREYYLSTKPKNYREIAPALGVTTERARQISEEAKAKMLKKIQRML
jgi:RNA polymerase sigma factor (sigma-70 family)